MNPLDIQQTVKRYSDRLKNFGETDAALGWTRKNKTIRFETLISEWREELNGGSICDFGCGFGDLFEHLRDAGVKEYTYTGIDINPDLLAVANQRYPEANFILSSANKSLPLEACDFIFSSGVFNHKLLQGGEYEWIEKTLHEFKKTAKKGFAVNFLSDKVEYSTAHNFNANPAKIVELAYSISNNVVLRNDYMPFEFTVFVRLDKEVNRETLTFL